MLPSAGRIALDLLRSSQPAPAESVLIALINDLSSEAEDLIIVMDDYHLISNKSIHNGIIFLLEHLPDRLRVVIIARADPPLPLPHFRGKGTLLEIRADDLRFKDNEAAALLNELSGLALTPADIKALNDRAEGWAVGLKMAILSLRGQTDVPAFISGFTGTQRYIMDYLLEEVLHRQPPEVRDFLLKTSVLDRLSGPLCDAVTGGGNGAEILSRLENDNLFIVPLDASREWYRYEHLFTDLLRHCLDRELGKEAAAELQKRASRWYEGNGFPESAINHALAAKDWEQAMKIISDPVVYIPRNSTPTMLHWLEAIPQGLLRADANLCLLYAWALIMTGQVDAAEPWLDHLESTGPSDDVFRGRTTNARAHIAFDRGDIARTEEYSKKSLALLPTSEAVYRASVCLMLGWHYIYRLLINQAEPLIMEAYECNRRFNNIIGTMSALLGRGIIAQLRGRLRQAVNFYQEAIAITELNTVAAQAHTALGMCYYEWNDLEAALAEQERAIELYRMLGIPVSEAPYLYMSFIQLSKGDIEGAAKALAEADRILAERQATLFDRAQVAAYHAALADAQDDIASRDRWLETFAEAAKLLPINVPQTVIYHLFRRGTPALEKLKKLFHRRFSRGGLQLGLTAMQVFHAVDASSPEQALPFLAEALAAGRPEGFVRVFVNMGMGLVPVLRQAIAAGIEPEYAGKLLDIIEEEERWRRIRKGEIPTSPPAAGLLSEREIDVLRLIAEELTNQQIADRLFISLHTAKTHVRHILDKLDVRGRVRAVKRARELGLL